MHVEAYANGDEERQGIDEHLRASAQKDEHAEASARAASLAACRALCVKRHVTSPPTKRANNK